MRHPALLALTLAPLLVLAAACVDGATPDCTLPNSGCIVVQKDASTEAGDGSASDASTDATDAGTDGPKPDAGDAGDAKND